MNPTSFLSEPVKRGLLLFSKLGGMVVMIGLLHIPLFMTHGILQERRNYQEQATREIAGIWGQRQVVTGPVLAVPYVYRASVARPRKIAGAAATAIEEVEDVVATAYFLPESLNIAGAVEPEIRRRGIFETIVYRAQLTLSGRFRPDFAAAGILTTRIDWARAQVLLGVTDLRGLRTVSPVTINQGRPFPFETEDEGMAAGLPLAARIEGATAEVAIDFALEAGVQGSERLDFVPSGKTTHVALTSPWTNPSFGGADLPARRTVGPEGFKAEWETSHFSRGFAQSWTSRVTAGEEMKKKFLAASFGAAFTQPVDGYRLVERAEKYGVLFFVLVFAVFFLFEVTASLRIHPLQYLLVGFALGLFLLGFLALSEFWTPGVAYGVAAAACTALVSAYAHTFLRTGGRTLVIASGLGATYGYLYFVLQSQDYALLTGTLALFAALAAVMYCTRRIDWYEAGLGLPGREPAK